MKYIWKYETPEGFDNLTLTSDGQVLTGLWFDGSRDESKHERNGEEALVPVLEETVRWLNLYFAGKVPDFTPAYRVGNLTSFREEVHAVMGEIPYGTTMTYGNIAREIARNRGLERMSAQAVGGAVGSNPICIIVPCHRVMGSDGSLTGYGGGVENKKALLELEGIL